MKGIFAALIAGALVACAPARPELTPTAGFRDPAAQIASQVNVTAQRMAGDWVIRQRFADQPGPARELRLNLLPNGALQVSAPDQLCLTGDCGDNGEAVVVLEPRGPGRWAPVGDQTVLSNGEIWVLWMDFDDRTVAIGTPSGEFGWIMDKSAAGGRDRIAAAREIMDWFGYDMARLRDGDQ